MAYKEPWENLTSWAVHNVRMVDRIVEETARPPRAGTMRDRAAWEHARAAYRLAVQAAHDAGAGLVAAEERRQEQLEWTLAREAEVRRQDEAIPLAAEVTLPAWMVARLYNHLPETVSEDPEEEEWLSTVEAELDVALGEGWEDGRW